MSVVDFSGGPSEPSFERTPPNNIEAEQSVLGGMLISKDAIADVVEVLRSDDFYRPAHQIVYEIITDLYGRGDPADAVTVFDELQRRGDVAKVGGGAYLHTLTVVVPTAANAGYYAKIVREQAVLRRLIEAGTRIVSYGYGGQNEEVDDLVDRAQAEIYKVTERRTSEDYLPLSEIMPAALDEIEAIGSRGGQMVGVPTGFQDLDALTNGLHPGQMIVVAARPAIGKALALDTPLPTPDGWTTMGEVNVGDWLIGADGQPARVVAATDVMHGRPCYEIEFSDGTVIVADAAHQWLTETRASRRSAQQAATGHVRHRNERTFASVKTTEQIAATLRCETADRRLNHAVPVAKTAAFPERELPFPPYALGAWLGDGHSAGARLTSADPEIIAEIEAEGLIVTKQAGTLLYSIRLPQEDPIPARACAVCGKSFVPRTSQVRSCGRTCGGKARFLSDPVPEPTCPDCGSPSAGLRQCQECRNHHGTAQAILRSMGVLTDKHIPQDYLRASEDQRRALLAGLLDTDGYVNPSGTVQFAVTSERLAEGAWELILSLGYKATWTEKPVSGRSVGTSTAYVITFTPADKVFRLPRKVARQTTRDHPTTRLRYVTDVRRVESRPVRCVEIDNADHMYLAGKTWIPTHNSTLGLDFARSAAIKHGLTTVIFSLEMSRNEITMRLLSAEARVALHTMRSGLMNDDDWTRMARRMGEVAEAPLFIDDSPNMSMMEIRAKCRRLKQRHDLKFVIVDYLQLMSSPKKTESRQQEVSELSRALKLLAKELEVPVIAISQLNRGPEQRTDKRPAVSDLRESGCLTANTRILRADTGAETTLRDLLDSDTRDIPVWSLDDRLKLVPRTLTHVFPSGIKPVYRVRLRSGRELEATANHPFLTYDGWHAVGDLAPGTRVAVPRHVPPPLKTTGHVPSQGIDLPRLLNATSLPDAVFGLRKTQLALLLRQLWASNGEIHWEANAGLPREGEASAAIGARPVYGESGSAPEGETLAYVHGGGAHSGHVSALNAQGGHARPVDVHAGPVSEGEVPAGHASAPDVQAGHAMAVEDGRVHGSGVFAGQVNDEDVLGRYAPGEARISFVGSRGLVDDLARLLLRFNVMTQIVAVGGAHRLMIYGPENQLRFLEDVGMSGAAAEMCARELRLRTGTTDPGRLPQGMWDRLRDVLIQPHGPGPRPEASTLGQMVAILDREDLEITATNDVFWDEIASVEVLGEQMVYDATVLGTHNFVANGISVHNSIEQDADMVILLHREDAYERESPRAGEADLIVAKHRNGPTATVTVAFQGHYSRFVDMAQH
ncbi:replicative DNA helicase [Acrocarpospora sp. B8E8]|uniref:replicative DNA helicase n=1 Tax=Acrocarpospora sp. B8E8 TaxID=3153572 RepID=UPI00325E4502